ncbi:MAG: efflux RND transporter permease subunit [Acidobacteria bacterium]|nr:efflux RND transporter permease subunit [Acidobacteriota bacterium]
MNGLISWFARNGVAANLLMIVIVVMGAVTIPGLKKEIFPEYAIDMVTVSVDFRGGTPEEIEETVCVRIEEEIQDLDGIKKITSRATEGNGTVTVEVMSGYDSRRLLDDIKSRVDSIDTFPDETEQPVVQEVLNRRQVINVSISGDASEKTLKRLGEQVRDEIMDLPGITHADLVNVRDYEISIEVSEDALRRHNLTFDFVAQMVRRFSLDLPGGSLKTETGEILLRTKGQAYVREDFEKLPLLTKPDGTKLYLEDVAEVVDGFTDTDQWAFFNGKKSVMIPVFRVGNQNAITVASIIRDYVEAARQRMPEGIAIEVWKDDSAFLRGRIDLLLRNAASGLVLVFIVLALFLRMRLAFWVTIGIPISFLGTLAVMPMYDGSINMISLFAMILVLGIVVDDAIVVGESIFTEQKHSRTGVEGAITGVRSVGIPVIFGVLTTVAAFAPMTFLPGYMGKIWRVIPLAVIPTLLFSLIESQLVLPYHLSHSRPKRDAGRRRNLLVRMWNGFFSFFEHGLEWFVEHIYGPTLKLALNWRYATVSVAVATLLLTVGLVGGGYLKFTFFPQVEADYVVGTITMPLETPVTVTERAIKKMQAGAEQLQREIDAESGEKVFQHVLATVGNQPLTTESRQNAGGRGSGGAGSHVGEVGIELTPSEGRTVPSGELANRWRELTGPIPGAVELKFTSDLLGGGADIDFQLRGRDTEALRQVSEKLKSKLATYPGVFDITDSFRGGKPEVKLALNSEGEGLGLSLQDLANQVRQGFYGEEAQRIQRGRDDIRVMVRYPKDERSSLGDLESMRVRTPSGSEVPFSTVAEAALGRGFANIQRVNRQRVINVTAEADASVTNENTVIQDVSTTFLLPLLETEYPSVSFTMEGQQREQMELINELMIGFGVALFVIYVLLAIPFKSYVQPLIVMTAVPFGIVGAVWGHWITGYELSIMSMLGVVALTGVVVNDSLVLVEYINRHRDDGHGLGEAVRKAGLVRFRPILLTSLTTAAGITPLMLEKSVQAQFLIPMAVALAFGVLFATVISLLLVPAGYVIIEDIQNLLRWMYRGLVWLYSPLPREQAVAAGSASTSGGTLLGANGFSGRPSTADSSADGAGGVAAGEVQRGPHREEG